MKFKDPDEVAMIIDLVDRFIGLEEK